MSDQNKTARMTMYQEDWLRNTINLPRFRECWPTTRRLILKLLEELNYRDANPEPNMRAE